MSSLWKKFNDTCVLMDDYLFLSDILLDDEKREYFKDTFLHAWNERVKWAENESKSLKENENEQG